MSAMYISLGVILFLAAGAYYFWSTRRDDYEARLSASRSVIDRERKEYNRLVERIVVSLAFEFTDSVPFAKGGFVYGINGSFAFRGDTGRKSIDHESWGIRMATAKDASSDIVRAFGEWKRDEDGMYYCDGGCWIDLRTRSSTRSRSSHRSQPF